MPEYLQLSLLFAVGIISGFMNVVAGGGSTLSLPALIFLGLDSTLANGTNRVAIAVQNIAAVVTFRQQNVHEFRKSFELSLLTLPGAIVGAVLAVNISDLWFNRILGIVMIGVVATMFFPFQQSGKPARLSRNQWLIYPSMFGIGVYGGFIQVGVGFLLMGALYHLLRLSLLHVNMHKVFIVLLYTLPAIFVFILTGNVHWKSGLILAAGTAVGAWWSARVSVKEGDTFIRYGLALAIAVMSLKLLGLF